MAEAAYKTIEVLQQMLDEKNKHIQMKEESISKMRKEMERMAEMHAEELNKLRE